MLSTDDYQIKRALISVSDKRNLAGFVKELSRLGIEIISTGGTAKLLKSFGLNVKSVSDITGFPEIMDGRVKTLHPAIHAGLLADLSKDEHLRQLFENGFESIDLLVVNLYPFEETLNTENITNDELIENIDIGGPAMLRSAAKNYKWTVPLVNPDRYDEIILCLNENNNCIPEKFRCELAAEVFSHTSYYDSLIAGYFNNISKFENPVWKNIPLKQGHTLRYGENPHQSASLYFNPDLNNFSSIFHKLHGKELSYNNILDIDSASRLILEFNEPALAIIKHTNPCGVATGENLHEAWNKAFATDTVSAYGGIISVNRVVNKELAETIHSFFAELIIAPEFSDEAMNILTKKKDRRLISLNFEFLGNALIDDYKSVAGGMLIQNTDRLLTDKLNMRTVTSREPTESEKEAMLFAWKVCKHVKSNAIVYTSNDRTLGIGAGQMSRVDSSRLAIEKAKQMNINLKNSVMASDAYFPFADGLLEAVSAGATAVIQPGGSVRDNEVIQAANDNNIAMIFTGMRHFKH